MQITSRLNGNRGSEEKGVDIMVQIGPDDQPQKQEAIVSLNEYTGSTFYYIAYDTF